MFRGVHLLVAGSVVTGRDAGDERSLPRHGTGRKLAGWIEPSRYLTASCIVGSRGAIQGQL